MEQMLTVIIIVLSIMLAALVIGRVIAGYVKWYRSGRQIYGNKFGFFGLNWSR